ncbi:MAG TPA: hypothetical protein VFO79_07240, partial [Xanthomonadales bacterium]|nr:hypothetical protein [Xanthomonadales bacterium]
MKNVSMLAVGLLLAASATTAVAQDRSREIDYGDRAESRDESREKRPAADTGYRSGAPRGGYDASGRTDRYDAN